MSGLIWVQSVCNGYEQTTLIGKELIWDMGCVHVWAYMLKNSQFSVGYNLPKEINEARKNCGRKQNTSNQNNPDQNAKLYTLLN